jgi:dTDP-L-rhamnose 4-epimerase
MIKNILITGGAGFIGSHLALTLVNKGYSVTVLDNLSAQIHGEDPLKSYSFISIKDKVVFIKGDVRNKEDFGKALTGQDAIIHLAAETGTGQSMYQIYNYSQVNIGGTALLLDTLMNGNYKVKKLILASSRAIYGEGKYYCSSHGEVFPLARNEKDLGNGIFECMCPHCGNQIKPLPTTEDSRIIPNSIYGITKYNQEQLILITGRSLNIPVVALRYQNVYGPGQSLSNPYTGILSVFSTQIRNNKPISIFEDGKESRDMVYIDDVVNATILGLENEDAKFNVLNVGTGRPIEVLSIAKILVRLFKSEVRIKITGNYRIGDIRHNYADLTEIKKSLNFNPQYPFEEGIVNYVNWVNSQRNDEDGNRYLYSLSELSTKGLFR